MVTRIYEVAKKHNKSSKEIIALLREKGFEHQSHMTVLGQEELTIIERSLRGAEKKPKKSVHAPVKQTKQEKKPFHGSRGQDAAPEQRNRTIRPEPVRNQKPEIQESSKPDINVVARPMTVGQAAEAFDKPVSDVLITLLRWGVMSAKNQVIEADMVVRLAEHYLIPIVQPKAAVGPVAPHINVNQEKLIERLPVIVVLGHVDHGKTTFLDFVRKTRIAEREKGGITQHIGAYVATTSQGNLVFIDTPGHEAFTKIRQRGARVADLAILVVAADDGIMPQTIEAIKHIKAANLPVVVAINKMDKADPVRLDVIKRQLAQQDLLPEDWGGQVVCVPISAKTGLGIDKLLEMVALQTQLLELRAEPDCPGKGYVLESKLDKGRGFVATILGKHGKIVVGDYFICGKVTGHVTSLLDFAGISVAQAGPSIPVQVAGFDALAEVGDYFSVVTKEEYRLARASHERVIGTAIQRGTQIDTINLIIKTDTNSSREALIDAIEKLASKAPVGIHVVSSSVGYVNESDVELAYNTSSRIIVLHTKVETKATALAQQRSVPLAQFSIIYKLLEYLEAFAESKRVQEMTSKKIGEAEVLRVFEIKGVGVIAGCRITDGKFIRDSSVVVWRDGYRIGSGKIVSLQREKRMVKEVNTGFECGFVADGLTDFVPGDRVECFTQVPVIRTT
jgi:translation initiation factor IF-2